MCQEKVVSVVYNGPVQRLAHRRTWRLLPSFRRYQMMGLVTESRVRNNLSRWLHGVEPITA